VLLAILEENPFMKSVAQYNTYEEANEFQITLLAAGIDCRVEKLNSDAGTKMVVGSQLGYHLFVPDEDVEAAKRELELQREEVSGFLPIVHCPQCKSANYRKDLFPQLKLISSWAAIKELFSSPMAFFRGLQFYVCRDCGHSFRYSLYSKKR